jgi:hypothetical protein
LPMIGLPAALWVGVCPMGSDPYTAPWSRRFPTLVSARPSLCPSPIRGALLMYPPGSLIGVPAPSISNGIPKTPKKPFARVQDTVGPPGSSLTGLSRPRLSGRAGVRPARPSLYFAVPRSRWHRTGPGGYSPKCVEQEFYEVGTRERGAGITRPPFLSTVWP